MHIHISARVSKEVLGVQPMEKTVAD